MVVTASDAGFAASNWQARTLRLQSLSEASVRVSRSPRNPHGPDEEELRERVDSTQSLETPAHKPFVLKNDRLQLIVASEMPLFLCQRKEVQRCPTYAFTRESYRLSKSVP